MSAFKRGLLSASEQIVMVAPDSLLNRWSVVARYAAVATLAVAGAGAHAWGENNQGPLPERQATRYGENIGGAIGRMVGLGAMNNPTNPGARAVQSAAIGIGEDIGRWMGGRAASAPYEKSPVDMAAVANSVPSADRDHLDTLALRAIFAADTLAKTPQGSREYRAQSDALYYAQRNFEMAYRAAADRRVDVAPWTAVRDVIQQAHRGVPEQRLAQLGQPIVERLNRQGGPGFDRQTPQVNPLAQLRQQAAQGANPVPRY